MSKVSITKSKLDSLANAVSIKSGEPIPLTLDEMTDAVLGLQTEEVNLQSKTATYTPTASQQTETITADPGYDGLEQVGVTINAVQTETATVNPTTSQQTVTPSAGKFLSSVTVNAANLQEYVVANITQGGDIPIYPDAGYLGMEYAVAHVANGLYAVSSTASSTQRPAIDFSDTTRYINISAGYMAAQSIPISAVPTMTLPTSAQTTDPGGVLKATITPSANTQYLRIPVGYNYSQASYQINPLTIGLYTIRPDAELIKTYTNDSLAVHDDGATLPAWKSTAATTIKSSANLSGTVSLDYDNYDYFAVERFLTIPVYNTDTIAASRNDYSFGTSMYEIVNLPANSIESMSGTKYGSRSVAVGTYTCYRLLYWTSASAVSVYTSSTYGIHQVTAAPSISSGKWTFKSPTLQFRGSSSYLKQAVYETVTDIRRQFVINVYRAPKNNLNYDAWGLDQSIKHIAACAITNTHTLT